MAALPDSDRRILWSVFMEGLSGRRERLALTKEELRSAVDAIDGWVDANATSFNQTIPLPARTALSARQKVELLTFVVRRRFEVS